MSGTLKILVAGLALASVGLSSCAMSPTPIADAAIDRVTSGDDDAATEDACRAIGRNALDVNETYQDLLASLGRSDQAIETAASSGSAAGRDLSVAWSRVYRAVAAKDQQGVYAAMERVFEVCGSVGIRMGWE